MQWTNAGLFSDHFLSHRVHEMADWRAISASELAQLEADLRAIRSQAEAGLATANEAQTENEIIRPFLDRLGHVYDVQTGLPAWAGRRVPDYAIFESASARAQAVALRGKLEFWDVASALIDAKGWNVGLDDSGAGGGAKTPGQQVAEYLRESDLRWAVVTNGRVWRLYVRTRGRQATQYFEISTDDALADADTLRLFWLIFGPRGLTPDPLRGRYCDLLLAESLQYATDIGERLRERAFVAVEALARGFARHMALGRPLTSAERQDTYSNSLVLLYRLLFVLSAEARGLLPLGNRAYRLNHSLTEKRQEYLLLKTKRQIVPNSTAIYAQLTALFGLVDGGDPETGIPPYNGGLFSAIGHPFLATHACPDPELAEAIVDLAFDQSGDVPQAIDYRDIQPRHLGTIYEGLLEFRLEIATQSLSIGRRDGIDVYRPTRRNEAVAVSAGDLYLRNDKNERRATGSYYTPDYIVDYMVENALDPLLADRSAKARGLLSQNPSDGDRQAEAREALLDLRVLDPACGSGHFLVAAMHAIADSIVTDPSYVPAEPDPDGRLLRRRIAERCLFGVDFNPLALELARLTVWLETVAPDRPLSFLDHHFRFGDGLIGSWVDQIAALRSGPRGTFNFAQDALRGVIPGILAELVSLSATDATTRAEHQAKEQKAADVQAQLGPYRQLADYWLAGAKFGQPAKQEDIDAAVSSLSGRGDAFPTSRRWRDAIDKSRSLKAFHWELEFPEVFFGANGDRSPNSGFDAVVGNPPYEVLETRKNDFASPGGMTTEDEQRYQSRRDELADQRRYFRGGDFPAETQGGKLDLFRLFLERNLRLVAKAGALAQIVPRSILADETANGIRALLWRETELERVDVFPKDPPECWVFPDAELAVAVLVARRGATNGTAHVRRHDCRTIGDGPFERVTLKEAIAIDPHGKAIPVAAPGDVALATRLYSSKHVCRVKQIAPCHIGEVNSETGRPFFADTQAAPFTTRLIRGADIGRFRIDERPEQRWLDLQGFEGSRPQGVKPWLAERVVKQAINDLSDPRRVVAGILPRGIALQDSGDWLAVKAPYRNGYLLAVLLADVNEWRFRMTSSNNNVNAYEVDELFFPTVSDWNASGPQGQPRADAAASLRQTMEAAGDDPATLLSVARRALSQGTPRAALHDVADALSREAHAALDRIATVLRTMEMTLLSYRGGHRLPVKLVRGRWVLGTDQELLNEMSARNVATTLQQRGSLIADLAQARAAIAPLRDELRLNERAAEAAVHGLLGLTDAEMAQMRTSLPSRTMDLAPIWS